MLTLEREFEGQKMTFKVAVVEERFSDKVVIYEYHPDAFIFKRHKIEEYVFFIAADIATKKGFDPKSEDFIVNVCNCALDDALENIRQQNEEYETLKKQKEYFKNYV